ncbi:hypothetical protein GMLC_15940 [Geomonas limicola]|uniref:Uncharacterized protein n=2 Tax=Geomonas limicola TaxID=2740186 RepID=A0A6V8N609_9BACT|nr:hypothetical protein GMLC_15940 [Geomonas limicola]
MRVLPQFIALLFLAVLVQLTGCAGRPLHISSTTSILTSGQNLTKGLKVQTNKFGLQDDIVFFVYVKWDEPTQKFGAHNVTFSWYKDDMLVSTTTKPIIFNTTPTEIWSKRAASALGAGHYKVAIAVEGNVVGSTELDIK